MSLSSNVRGRDRAPRKSRTLQTLSPRQTQVVEFIKHGLHGKEIAQALQISPESVGVTARNARKKLNLDSNYAVRCFFNGTRTEEDTLP